MDFSSINWLAVIACVVVSMITGSIWFGPKTLFPIWWKAIGKTEKDIPGGDNMGLMWGGTILASFIQAVSLAIMVNFMGAASGGATLVSGMRAGFMLWFGFVAATSVTNKLFAGQLKAWALETGNHLINFVLFGAILGTWH